MKRELGADSKMNLCITGGLDEDEVSRSLGQELIKQLENQGFVIGECDIGGNFFRSGTIYPDRVEILREKIGENESEKIVLNFTKMDIDT